MEKNIKKNGYKEHNICITELLCYTEEISTTLYINNYNSLKDFKIINLKKKSREAQQVFIIPHFLWWVIQRTSNYLSFLKGISNCHRPLGPLEMSKLWHGPPFSLR